MSPQADDPVSQADPRNYFDEDEPDMVLSISFKTAVFMANSMPSQDEVTKAFKRLIRMRHAASLELNP